MAGNGLLDSVPLWLRYVVAVASVALAAWAIPWMDGESPVILFVLPVLIAAYMGGLGPGLLATALSELSLAYWYLEPINSFEVAGVNDQLRMAIFPVVGVVISLLSHALRRSRQQLNWMLSSITDCYMMIRNDWRVADINESAAGYLGAPPREIRGKRLWDLAPDIAGTQLESEFRRAMGRQTEVHFEARLSEERQQWAEIHAYPVPGGLVIYFRNISDRMLAEESLRESEERFRKLAESARAMIGIVRDRRFVYVNPYLEKVTGYTRDELMAVDIADLVHPAFRELVLDRARRRAAGEAVPSNYEYQLVTKSGEYRWVDISLATINLRGQPAIIGIGYDITRRKEVESELERAKDQAEEANRLKDQFLAALSHELRTPLTPVLLVAETLAADTSLPHHLRSQLEMIGRNMQVEARLIDDLLDLTRIARGKLELHLEPTDVHEMIRYAVEASCHGDAKARQLHLSLELEAGHHHVQGDPARIQQVFWNLLKNAIKFTPSGGSITLRTRNLPREGQERPQFVAEITDTGVGIEPDRLSAIFNAFEQGDPETTRRFCGLGLGLSITKALVDLHGGSIAGHSPGRGQGSTFVVELPTIPAPAQCTQPQCGAPEPAARPLRILVVEDHESTAQTLANLLRSEQHDVQVAGTVAEALQLATKNRFDLVISDLGLPDGNGLDLMRTLKQRLRIKGIALSGYGMEDDIRRSHEAGFEEHLTKPINMSAVDSALARLSRAEERGRQP